MMTIINAFTKLEIYKVVARGSNPGAETPYEKHTEPKTIYQVGNKAKSLVGYTYRLHSRSGYHLWFGRDDYVHPLLNRQSGLVELGIKGGHINYHII